MITKRNTRKLILKLIPKKVKLKLKEFILNKESIDFERVTEFDKNLKTGINCIGHLKGQFGLGQGARLLCRAIQDSKYDFAAIDVDAGSGVKYGDNEFDSILTNNFPYNINILNLIPHYISRQISKENLKKRYNIGYWLFELEDIPKIWYKRFEYVNEIWTPSNFCSDAFKKVSPVPVFTIPYAVEAIPNKTLKKEDFNLPYNKFLYLVMFDSLSSFDRKNPKDAIKAFVEAFPENDDVCLVIKINNSQSKHIRELERELKTVKHYRLIDKVLDNADLYSLISLCDVLVSLHRGEGFGLVMAEAMLLGTVCIATNYSANTDFMNKDNSCLVDYKLFPIRGETNFVYAKGKWAHPDVKQASEYMITLFKDKELYNTLRKNAQEYILNEYSMKKSVEKLEKRVDQIIKDNNL
jgi:glycosyltransferase involved in cell wall biosynthesis